MFELRRRWLYVCAMNEKKGLSMRDFRLDHISFSQNVTALMMKLTVIFLPKVGRKFPSQ